MVSVIGIGALNWDSLYLVDRIASAGDEIVIKAVRGEAGGSAANTIAALGRLGVSSGFIGKIGDDEAGDRIASAFERDGVGTSGITRVEGRTGQVLSFVDEAGERSMYVDPGVNNGLFRENLNRADLSSATWVHVSSFAGGKSLETLMDIPKILGGAKLSFAPGFLSYRGMDFLMPLLSSCDTIFLNESEARALTAASAEGPGPSLLGAGVNRVIVTLGSKGCALYSEKEVFKAGGLKVKAVDTTGAGDAFAGGFIFGILKGFDDRIAAELGNFAASRCIQKIGARSGLPDLGSLEDFLEKNPGALGQ